LVSAASVWQIATKHRLGMLPEVGAIAFDLEIHEEGFDGLPISVRHTQVAGALPGPHKDPFDWMLVAQALVGGLTLVSNERIFDAYGVARLW
jgi:PIN domain nuclease of toxin-antitoxin system